MAANPAMTECLKDVWTKIVENKTAGTISKTESNKSEAPSVYLQTYRLTGDSTAISDDEGVVMFEESDTEIIDFDTAVDIYVKALSADGELRVNL
jgi:hypothetical protein